MIMTAISIILIYVKDPNVSENYSKTCLKHPKDKNWFSRAKIA